MSVRAMAELAGQRDRVEKVDDPGGGGHVDDAQGGTPADNGQAGLTSATGVLIHAVPSEVLAPYTALVAIVVANSSAKNDREVLRWSIFAIAIALLVVALVAASQRTKPQTGRRFPLLEVVAATIAFAAWGLVMPGSPLSLQISGGDLAIASAAIAIGGAFLITLISPALGNASVKAPARQHPTGHLQGTVAHEPRTAQPLAPGNHKSAKAHKSQS